jgi:DNA invertase Pin-like site-specific DNA recombinase
MNASQTKGQLLGYARASSADQDTAIQEAALAAAGCSIIRAEKRSGTSLAGRDELATLISFARPGDSIVVTRIDRLARSIADLASIVRQLEEKGVALRAVEQPVDTSTAAGRAFLQMLGVFAEFETAIRRERQMEGIARAKQEGVYTGRKPSIDPEAVRKLRAEGKGATEIAKALGVARASVYRLLGDAA